MAIQGKNLNAGIKGRAWIDVNGSGTQDAEAGKAGVTVELYNVANGALVSSVVTGTDGTYSFAGLAAGDYTVRFVAADGTRISEQDLGDDELDSDINLQGETDIISLSEDQIVESVDAGFYPSASVGDRVWIDANANGVQDEGEAGKAGVTVELRLSADGGQGQLVETQVTDASGNYKFTGLDQGSYQIRFIANDGSVLSTANVGSDELDSDADGTTGLTGIFELTAGDDNTSVDAGFAQQQGNDNAVISGRAWVDANGSGTQDDPETGKAGVTVELYSVANGALVSSMVTGADGTYSFAGLAEGDYTVRFVAADGTLISERDLGDDELDSDINADGETDIINLGAGQVIDTVDAGFYPSASVGDRVWIDVNANGVQDDGEAGKAGVTVELRLAADGGQGTLVATTVTDANGNYKFIDLDQGSYQIRFIANDGSVLSTANVGSDELDSDADGAGLTGIFELTAGDDNTSVDAGFVSQQNNNAVISGRAWVDTNGSGTQDDPEAGKAGVTVELYNVANGALVSSMVTGADGTYSFAGLAEGDYTVRFVAADGSLISEQDLGDDELDSDINADGETDTISLGAGQVIDTVDAGFYPSASVGDRVWIDVNANGVQDEGEAGKAGVTVELRLAADGGQGTLVATTVTDANGNYKFIDLDQGSYQIRFIANDGSVLSTANVGSDELDSDADGTGLTGIFELTAGENDTTVDAGFVQTDNAVISGRAWVDTNGSGTQDDPEAGKAGVTVELYNVANGALVSSMVTGADGTYSFAGLAEGDYTVRFVAADGSLISEQDLGDDELDSDINADGETDTISLGAGQVIDTVDAGFYPSASVGDRVWIDANANGVQDDGEAGKAGVTVELLLAADGGQGTLVATTVTDANGNYKFIDLDQGSYQIRFIANDGSVLSTANVGSDELDSDADGTGLTGIFELTAGENDTTVDAGFVQTDNAVISGRAWVDTNGSGTQDDPEAGKAGVTVELYNVANGALVSSMVTGADGTYSFAGLAEGDYTVRFVAADGSLISEQDLGDDELDSDINADGETDTISLGAGQVIDTVDAGFYPSASVGDRVWIDANANGVQDEGEAGKAGVTVELLLAADGGQGTLVATTVTDANGNYKFIDLDQGSYQIRFIANDGSILSTANVGSDELDSDADGTGLTGIFELTAGENDTTVDAGFVQTDNAVISGRAWVDANGGGTQEPDEAGKAGVTVELYTVVNGQPGELVGSMLVNPDGTYSFAGLEAGDYTVRFVADDGSLVSVQDFGDDELDSDIKADGYTNTINLGVNQIIDTVDAGFYPTASVGDRVWIDENLNNVQDEGEVGKAGVTVELYLAGDGGLGRLVATQVTDANGNYQFTGLDQGSYQIRFINDDGSILSTADVGSDELDSDADGNGITGIFELTPGENDTSVDAGFQPSNKGAIGGRAWLDANGGGSQEPDEVGKGGVTVELHRVVDGQPSEFVGSMLTNADGTYNFTGLEAGDYFVRFFALDGSLISEQNFGDDELDSDINAEGETGIYSLGVNEVIDTVDAGFYPTASLGDRVWVDMDADGVQDEGEKGKANVTVELYTATDGGPGELVASTVTDANGNYLFERLDLGSYQVKFIANDGAVLSTTDVGSDELDSDADGTTGLTGIYELTPGEVNTSVDAGYLFQPLTEIQVCEDTSKVFNVLEGQAPGAKLVGVSHETASLNTIFKQRGGAVSFTEEGQINYKTMTNYYGFDKLVYTIEDADGTRHEKTVDVTVNGVSDAPDQAKYFGAHPGGWSGGYHDADGKTHWLHTYNPAWFSYDKFSDKADVLQQFGTYNKDNGVVNDTDTLTHVRLYGLTRGADQGAILFDGKVLDFSNGQTYDVSIADLWAGKLKLDFSKAFTGYYLEYAWVDSGSVENDACYDGNIVSNLGGAEVATPIALDLNGDGQIGVTGATSSHQKDADAEIGRTVQFDIDADGTLDVIEWYDGSGDGILIDNRDGQAATDMDGARLFGDQGGQYADGYAKLATLDANGDGQLSGQELEGVELWLDNGDAIVQDGEIQTLAAHGIAAISTEVSIVLDAQGKEHLQSSATRGDGSTVMSEDVFFLEDVLAGDNLDALVGPGAAAATAAPIELGNDAAATDSAQAELLRQLSAQMESQAIAA